MGNRVTALICFSIGLMISGAPKAAVYAPRVVSENNADAYSMKTFADFPDWRDLYGDAKAWQMFSYLTDYQTGLYPMGAGATEGDENLYELSLVRDPVKIINVYGFGYCDVFGPVMAGIWQDAGLGDARSIDLPYNDHVTTEVFYDNAWHYLDLDLRAAFRRSDDSLASLEDSKYDPSLWEQPIGPLFFPQDELTEVRDAFEQSDYEYRYNVHPSGHTMDFVLRQGESFERWWTPQGGRWHNALEYDDDEFNANLIDTAPRGPKSKHPTFSEHSHGNGKLLYEPNLKQGSSDFQDGVYDSANVSPGTNGLTLTESGSGYAVFEVRTPYVIVPIVGNTATTNDDNGASVIDIDASNTTYSVSIDNGITWKTVQPAGTRIDLTSIVAGKYGYLFKVNLSGQAVLRSLTMTTWVQLAPASLPSLRQGANRMQFRSGDHYGFNSRVMEINPDTSDPDDLLKHLVVTPTDYTPEQTTSRIRGAFVAEMNSPPATKIAWFSAGASFETYQLESAPNTTFTMSYAAEVPFAFTEIYAAQVPDTMEHWHTNAHKEIRLAEPANAVYIRYEGNPAVNAIRLYAHVIEDSPRTESPLQITHQWVENGDPKTFTISSDTASEYTIDVAGQPINTSITLSVASVPASAQNTNNLNDDPIGGSNSDTISIGGMSGPTTLVLALLLIARRLRLRQVKYRSFIMKKTGRGE